MKKDLKGRIALIVAVLVVFIYGIFGVPAGLSGSALLQSITKRIHLGLDLQGGAHLILQVVVKEAVSAETDSALGRIQQALKTANLTYSQVIKPDPLKPDGTGRPEVIRIEGIAPGKSSDVRSLLDSKFSNEYDVASGSGERGHSHDEAARRAGSREEDRRAGNRDHPRSRRYLGRVRAGDSGVWPGRQPDSG